MRLSAAKERRSPRETPFLGRTENPVTSRHPSAVRRAFTSGAKYEPALRGAITTAGRSGSGYDAANRSASVSTS